MRLARASHERIEEFLRAHYHDELLKLPPVQLHKGRLARWLTKTFRIGAITFGRHIFINPELIRRNQQGHCLVPGWLIAHEAVHVLQYEHAGFVRFLFAYLRGYYGALRTHRRWDRAARNQAYRALKEECDAYAAESAYPLWKADENDKDSDD
jgi:hypothetical protein